MKCRSIELRRSLGALYFARSWARCLGCNNGKRIRNLAIAGTVYCGVLGAQANAQLSIPPQNQRPAQAQRIENGPAATVQNESPRIQVYDIPMEMVGPVAARLQILYANDTRTKITTEPQTGQLMVMALPSVHAQIAARIDALRKEIVRVNPNGSTQSPSTIRRDYKLQTVDWRVLEAAIQGLGGTRMTVTTHSNGEIAQYRMSMPGGMQDVLQVNRMLDTVYFQGTPTNVMAWQQVVSAIDSGKGTPDTQMQIVPLAPADPAKANQAIQLIRAVAQQDPANPQVTQTIPLGNAVQPPLPSGNAQATTVIGSRGQDVDSGLLGDVQIEFVPDLDIIIIKGAQKDVQKVLQVIEQIKTQSLTTTPKMEIVLMKHVNAQALELILDQLYAEVLQNRQGNISTTPLGQPNALLLIGREDAIKSVKELIEKLDTPMEPTSSLETIRLLNASAVDAENTIELFFQVDEINTFPRPGLGLRINVVSDYRTNTLIVQASPRDMIEIKKLVKEIDSENIDAQNELKVFTLSNTLAANVYPILQSAITGTAFAGTGVTAVGGVGGAVGGAAGGAAAQNNLARPPSSQLMIQTTDSNGRVIGSGILAGASVSADTTNNKLLVRAPSKSMKLFEELIKQLDTPPGATALIKVFEIKNGDATSLALQVQQVFGLQPTAGNATTTGGLFGGLNNLIAGAAQQQTGLTAGGDSSLVQLRVTPDMRTNTIIASGSKASLDVIEVLLLRLDQGNVADRTTEVIWLRNANAAEIATALNALLTQQRTNLTQQQALGIATSPYAQQDSLAVIQADATTNSLILSATPRSFKTIREVIKALDRRPPLILVEVLMAEVSLDDNIEFGTEWGLQDALLFDRGAATRGTLGTPAFNIDNPVAGVVPGVVRPGRPQNIAGQGGSNFGLGRSNANLGYGGLVLAASSESVNMLLRALRDANRLQILSSPKIMTVDNVIATVQVGQNVPRVSGVTATTTGQQIAVNAVDVGLILSIQPRTNADGLILMNVSVTRSSVGPEATGIPVGFGPNGEVIRSPIINQTNAVTRVSAHDNETVVISGLISKTRSSRARRIPFLSDIPIAGHLFRFDSESESRSELLVVMTPRIINSEEELIMVNQVESSRMSWCMADVLNIFGDSGLSEGNGLWGPAASPVIYPDNNPLGQSQSAMPGESLIVPTDSGVTPPSNNYLRPAAPSRILPPGIQFQPANPSLSPIEIPSPLLEPSAYYQGSNPYPVSQASQQNPTNVEPQRAVYSSQQGSPYIR